MRSLTATKTQPLDWRANPMKEVQYNRNKLDWWYSCGASIWICLYLLV